MARRRDGTQMGPRASLLSHHAARLSRPGSLFGVAVNCCPRAPILVCPQFLPVQPMPVARFSDRSGARGHPPALNEVSMTASPGLESNRD